MTGPGDRFRAGLLAYRQRWKRRELLARAWAARRALTLRADRTAAIRPGDILAFATVRNEAARLPFFLDHHRRLGVRHFLMVDNASTDDTPALLRDQPDVSLWHTDASYRASRFGLDWTNRLLAVHGSGHWCLTLDADEILIYPDWERRDLIALTRWLEARGADVFAAMMLDLYPEGRLSAARYVPGTDPALALPFFDPGPYRREVQARFGNVSIRGGVRERVFFSDRPDHSPHLHKTPLIRWHWRHAYLSSTHIALPRRLNRGFLDESLPTGVLLHSKFLPGILPKSAEEKARREHFTHAEHYDGYYDAILDDPVLWHEGSARLEGWRQLAALGLMRKGDWL